MRVSDMWKEVFAAMRGTFTGSGPIVILKRDGEFWEVTIARSPFPNWYSGTLVRKGDPHHEPQTGSWYCLEGPVEQDTDRALIALAGHFRTPQAAFGKSVSLRRALTAALQNLRGLSGP